MVAFRDRLSRVLGRMVPWTEHEEYNKPRGEEGKEAVVAKDDEKTSSGCSKDFVHKHREKIYLLVWLLWLLVGTMFYCYAHGNKLGFFVGFYQAVNIGYSIGYGFPRETHIQNWWFSSVYVIFGASMVGVALSFFADKLVEEQNDWFKNMLERKEYEKNVSRAKPLKTRFIAFVKFNKDALRTIGLWGIWILIMIMYSMIQVGWPFSQAQYFAVSTCSTGGHWPIPDDSPEWLFGVTGFFAALGVPLMGVAMASLASLIMERNDDLEETKETIKQDVTGEELLDLQRFGLEDGDGEIDRAEFVILCMMRLGTDPRLIQYISERFNTLDDDGSKSLSILEITRGRVSCDDLQKLASSDSYKGLNLLAGGSTSSLTPLDSGGAGFNKKTSTTSLTSIREHDVHEEEDEEEKKEEKFHVQKEQTPNVDDGHCRTIDWSTAREAGGEKAPTESAHVSAVHSVDVVENVALPKGSAEPQDLEAAELATFHESFHDVAALEGFHDVEAGLADDCHKGEGAGGRDEGEESEHHPAHGFLDCFTHEDEFEDNLF